MMAMAVRGGGNTPKTSLTFCFLDFVFAIEFVGILLSQIYLILRVA
jgi:hypothetical protein